MFSCSPHVLVGFVWALQFPPTLQKPAYGLIVYPKTPLGMNECVYVCMHVALWLAAIPGHPGRFTGSHPVFLGSIQYIDVISRYNQQGVFNKSSQCLTHSDQHHITMFLPPRSYCYAANDPLHGESREGTDEWTLVGNGIPTKRSKMSTDCRCLKVGKLRKFLSVSQGISQAAGYIYKKLVNDGILRQAFSIAPVSLDLIPTWFLYSFFDWWLEYTCICTVIIICVCVGVQVGHHGSQSGCRRSSTFGCPPPQYLQHTAVLRFLTTRGPHEVCLSTFLGTFKQSGGGLKVHRHHDPIVIICK